MSEQKDGESSTLAASVAPGVDDPVARELRGTGATLPLAERQWPEEARDPVYNALAASGFLPHAQARVAVTDAVLAALEPHVVPRARIYERDYPDQPVHVVRRRPAGPWEVAPDA